MMPKGESQVLINNFIHTQVIGRGLDDRTAKAYRLDLEKLYRWMEPDINKNVVIEKVNFSPLNQEEFQKDEKCSLEEKMEAYLSHLSKEKGLRHSTIGRKHRVFGYYLSYLSVKGIIQGYRPLNPVMKPEKASADTLLTKKEVDAFFKAIHQEYTELDSDFRRRVCLRDQIMMKLLFYHGMEVSELLRLEVSDYNQKTAVLIIHRKKEKERSIYLYSKELQEQMAQWISEHEYFEHEELYHNFLFLSKLGKPLSMKMVINIFDKYRVQAGIEKVCKPKDLKNSLGRYAEEMLRAKVGRSYE